MLSFDVSAIDMVLVLAVIILLFLYASKKPHESKNEKPHVPALEKPHESTIEKLHARSRALLQALPIKKSRSLPIEKPHVPAIKLQVEEKKLLQDNYEVVNKTLESRNGEMQSQANSQSCAHNFGYLTSLPKNTPIPDECLCCPNVMKCLSQKSSP